MKCPNSVSDNYIHRILEELQAHLHFGSCQLQIQRTSFWDFKVEQSTISQNTATSLQATANAEPDFPKHLFSSGFYINCCLIHLDEQSKLLRV